jgi:hypothetical protein
LGVGLNCFGLCKNNQWVCTALFLIKTLNTAFDFRARLRFPRAVGELRSCGVSPNSLFRRSLRLALQSKAGYGYYLDFLPIKIELFSTSTIP